MNRLFRVGVAAVVMAGLPAGAAIISDGAGLGATADWGGVGKIGTGAGYYGTGTLIDSTHVLTAAHLVDGLGQGAVTFFVNGQQYTSAAVVTHPQYDGGDHYDLAVITLTAAALGAPTYAINGGSVNELTAGPAIKVGFGYGGDGAAGTTPANKAAYPYGTARAGVNAIDLVSTIADTLTDGRGNSIVVQPGLLAYDFDNHLTGTTGPLGGAALGPGEVNTTEGDSGGPMFQFDSIAGRYVIVGVTVNGADPLSRFGDIGLDVRVSANAEWIASRVPEPGTAGVLCALAMLVMGRRRRLA